MKDERGGAALLTILVLISLIGLIAYAVNRLQGMSAVMGNAYQGKEGASHIAEAGIQNAIWELKRNSNWVTGFVNKPFGAGNFSVTAVKNPDGTTTVASTGAVGQAKETIQRRMTSPCTTATTTLNGNDTYIWSNQPNTNYNFMSQILVSAQEYRGLLYFDLSVIPLSAVIQSADMALYLYVNGADDTIIIYRVTAQWVDALATWNSRVTGFNWTTPGGDYDPGISWNLLSSNPTGWKTADIRSLVQDWVNGTYPNYGMILKDNNALDYFYSREYLMDPTLAPKLTVTYSLC
ncbi:MAG: DNRLRE domain-containing protein [Nitrospirae bacterium]|nr:DNRLRE domain-containing protein [Nitrospirota bacterium]